MELSTGETWLSRATRPIVAMTAVSARRMGTLAATSAPKAMSRMIRVIGSEVTKALLKSSPIAVLSSFSALASPNCSTVKPGWAACAALVAASVGSTRSGLGLRARDLEAQQGRVPVTGDLPAVARRVGALERLGVRCGDESALDVGDRRPEGRVVRRGRSALDEDLLGHVLGEGVVDRLGGAARLADSALRLVLRDQAGRVADRKGEEREGKPAPDRLLAVLRAPTTGPGGNVPMLLHGVSLQAP